MPLALALTSSLCLLAVLAGMAYLVERRRDPWGGWLANPLVFTLALGVYYTGWGYFGGGAGLVRGGLSYVPHWMGWIFLFLFGWPLLLKALRFARAHKISTLPSFFALRFEGEPWLGGLVAVFLVAAMLPYIALQLQAIAFALETLTTSSPDARTAWVIGWALLLAGFAVLFGGLQADPTRRLPGFYAAVAAAGALKLAAVLAVATYALWRYGPRFPDLPAASIWPPAAAVDPYPILLANLVISIAGVLMLPHVFHIAVVEAPGERAVRTSRWSFPLYGWLFDATLMPVTLAGLVLGLRGVDLQAAVLVVPEAGPLRLVAFLGGIAAASAMVLVTLLSLANTVLLDVVLPALRSRVVLAGPYLVPLRAAIIVVLALMTAMLWRLMEVGFLYEFGLLTVVAIAQLAPAFFLGLVWPGLSGRAAGWGLVLAIGVWLYTALLPSMAAHVPMLARWATEGPWGVSWLRPGALFGVEGLPGTVHAYLWCTVANLGALLWIQARHAPSREAVQRARELLAGLTPPRPASPARHDLDWPALEGVVASFLGEARAASEIGRIRAEATSAEAPEMHLLEASRSLERSLRGPLGPAAARQAVEQLVPLSGEALASLALATRQLNELLALSQEELAARLQNLSVLNEELERRVAERTKELALKHERLESTIEELHELERQKGAFFNTISHDLRIPLTGILGYGEMLEEGLAGDLGPQQREFVRNMIESARRMTDMLNDLLDFARLEAGQLAVMPRPTSLPDLVRQALTPMRPALERKQLRLRTDLPAELPDVLADPDRVVQVLSNLLSNATKFTPQGGAITVRAAVQPDGSALRVEVVDSGVGIPPEDMAHLFGRFFQTAAGRRAGGTGLGLHVSKGLIEAQGGTMGVESQPAQGSTFWLSLPLAGAEGPVARP